MKTYLSKNYDNTSTTTFNKTVLPPPVLNITGLYLSDELFQMDFADRDRNPYNDPEKKRWNFQGHSFDRHTSNDTQLVKPWRWVD
jgi:hypothetical protein